MGTAIGLRDTGVHATTMGRQAAAVDAQAALWVQIRQLMQRWACGCVQVLTLAFQLPLLGAMQCQRTGEHAALVGVLNG